MKRPAIRKLLKAAGILVLVVLGLVILGGGLFAVQVFSREPVRAVPSTTHASIARSACLECHAPIAEEWRQSYHYRSVSGPYWREVERMGYVDLFKKLRKPCMSCHAPANVLDLPATASGGTGQELGIECTPNLLRQPRGVIPALRADDIELGVDCVSCHVSRHGIKGPGRHPTAEHETIADRRFQNAALTSDAICKSCHRSAVDVWKTTKLAGEGVSCLDCHMPFVQAPSVVGGPERMRRSHRFLGDKDETTLHNAVHASLDVTDQRQARFRILNDRVGHFLPSGANWLAVYVRARDGSGKVVREHKEALGRDEALLLDFWPFVTDKRIWPGKQKEILLSLPEGHGWVEAVVRYHDWMRVSRTVVTLKESY